MRVSPPPSRLRIREEGGRTTFEIPSKPNWFLTFFLGFWLCAWLVGEITVPIKLFSGSVPTPAALAFIAWLGGWTVGGAVVMTIFGWNIAGREIVSLARDDVSIRHDVAGFGFTRTYDVAHMSRLRLDRALPTFRGVGGGRIAFDYGASTVRFGYRLDDPDANRIIDAFAHVHPQLVRAARSSHEAF